MFQAENIACARKSITWRMSSSESERVRFTCPRTFSLNVLTSTSAGEPLRSEAVRSHETVRRPEWTHHRRRSISQSSSAISSLLLSSRRQCRQQSLQFRAPNHCRLRRRWQRVRGQLLLDRQREPKDSAVGLVRGGPYPSPVSFDDRTADRESHAHAAGLGRVECVERRSRLSGFSPGPESCTSTSTPFDASSAVLIINSRDPSLTSLIASTALTIKLRITCCSWTRSP